MPPRKVKNASYRFTDFAISRCPSKRDISRTKWISQRLPAHAKYTNLIIKHRHPTNKTSIYINLAVD